MSPRAISVFGSSEPLPGDRLYESARELGRRLAHEGRPVLTGGYGGVMEGASRGASEAGGRSIGVVCSIFADRSPNSYLSEVIPSRDLHERNRLLVEGAAGFVVLDGKAGTLAELALLWALHRAGCLARRPVVLLGDPWLALVEHLERSKRLESAQLEITHHARTPEEAVIALRRALPGEEVSE